MRPLALTFGLLSPASGGVGGGRGSSDTADALASPSRRVLRERPSPRWGGLYRCCAVPPRAGARACLVGPSVVPLERSRSSLRCLRPSGGVVSLNPGVLLGSPPRWCVCVSREVGSFGGGSRPKYMSPNTALLSLRIHKLDHSLIFLFRCQIGILNFFA